MFSSRLEAFSYPFSATCFDLSGRNLCLLAFTFYIRLYFSLGGKSKSSPFGLILNIGPFSTTFPFEFLFIK